MSLSGWLLLLESWPLRSWSWSLSLSLVWWSLSFSLSLTLSLSLFISFSLPESWSLRSWSRSLSSPLSRSWSLSFLYSRGRYRCRCRCRCRCRGVFAREKDRLGLARREIAPHPGPPLPAQQRPPRRQQVGGAWVAGPPRNRRLNSGSMRPESSAARTATRSSIELVSCAKSRSSARSATDRGRGGACSAPSSSPLSGSKRSSPAMGSWCRPALSP